MELYEIKAKVTYRLEDGSYQTRLVSAGFEKHTPESLAERLEALQALEGWLYIGVLVS